MSTSNEFDRPKCPSCGDVGTTGEYGYKKCSNCGWRWNQKYKTTGKHQIEYSVANGVTYEQIEKVRALLSIGQNVTNIAETTAVPIKVILKIKDSASAPILDGQEFEPVNVLKQLAFGNNPVTGEPLPADHLIKMSCVNRALLLGALTLSENETEKEVSNPKKEKSSIEDWTEFEEQQVVDLFLQGQSAEEIRIKLNKLAKSVRGKIRRFFWGSSELSLSST